MFVVDENLTGDIRATIGDIYGDLIHFEFMGHTDKAVGIETTNGTTYYDLSEEDTRRLYEFLKTRLGE
jgi:hypothetical protein